MPNTIFLAASPIGVMYALYCAELSGIPTAQRVLVIARTGIAPVLATPLDRVPELQAAVSQFSVVMNWNEFVAPDHPAHWDATRGTKRALDARAEIEARYGQVSGLVLVSLQAPPAKALANIFADVPITVYSDGLMAYGAAGKELALHIGERVTKFVYLDILPAVEPAAFRPYGTASYVPVDVQSYYDWVAAACGLPLPEVAITEPTAVVVGQYLADLGLITPAEDEQITARMAEVANAAGATRVVVRAHPGSASATTGVDEIGVGALGMEIWLNLIPSGQRSQVTVVSVFSTALLTAKALGFDVVAVATDRVLEVLPSGNSNYLPVAICDSTVPSSSFMGDASVRRSRAGEDATSVAAFRSLLVDVFACIRQPGEYWLSLPGVRSRVTALQPEQHGLLRRYVTLKQLENAGLTSIRKPRATWPRRMLRRWMPKPLRAAGARALRAHR